MHKYKPQTREKLQKLVQDENIYFGNINTGLIKYINYYFN
ncbi:hypothetical protein BHWA1_02415 [Brachyspira hyodysenteriae WA1]|uniref:Uncharacterized protein n=1 Tax=Brachyspira hyodysenteriae (strain ATCC 49526 / WA1) TaxID=565034 RepID=A0A3B6VAX7_BRAHW|nr:hypothetical protein BHWA1_02415 [Brachyspira hyodysenteriae WA1]